MIRSVGVFIAIIICIPRDNVGLSTDKPVQDLWHLEEAGGYEKKYGERSSNEIIIVLDLTGSTRKNGINQIIAKTAKNLIMYQLPHGITVGLIQIGIPNYVIQPMTILKSRHQREQIIAKIMDPKSAAGEASPMDGISLASTMMTGEGTNVLVLSDESWHIKHQTSMNDKTISELCKMKWNVANIVFSRNGQFEDSIKVQLLSFRNNSLVVSHEWTTSNSVAMLNNIMDTFSHNWGMNNHYNYTITIYQRELFITQNVWSESFEVDSLCREKGNLQVSLHNWFQSECSLQLILPDGEIGVIHEDLKTIWSSTPNPLNGTWNITVSCFGNENENNVSLIVQEIFPVNINQPEIFTYIQFNCVACEEVEGKKEDCSNLCCNENNGMHWWPANSRPLRILAEIKANHIPIDNAEVMVIAQEISNATIKETLNLHDGGWGADGVDGDGIYSGFFTPSLGTYHHCRESESPCIFSLICVARGVSPSIGNYQRQIRGHPFKAMKMQEVYPPGFIHNLEGSVTNCSSVDYPQGIVISWTTTGESLDSGKALETELHFDIKMSSLIIDGIKHQMDIEEETFPHTFGANAPGQKQEHHICFPKNLQGQSLCFQLYSALNWTAVSNPICVLLSNSTAINLATPDSESNYSIHYHLLVVVILVFIISINAIIIIFKEKLKKCCSCQSGSWSPQKTSQNQSLNVTYQSLTQVPL